MNKNLIKFICLFIPRSSWRKRFRKYCKQQNKGVESINCFINDDPVKDGMLISFAQDGEDITLFKLLSSVEKGFYVDVGCSDPNFISVTKFFYDREWSGINIDPLKDEISKYEKERPRDINLCTAISAAPGELMFYECGTGSTFSQEYAEKWSFKSSYIVEVTTLNDIFEKYNIHNDIHFLKIDVEDHEKEVLMGIDLQKYRPWVIAMESALPGTEIPCYDKWESILINYGYEFITDMGINRYYCANERKDLVSENLRLSANIEYYKYWKL